MRVLPILLALPLLAAPPRFTPKDAIQAEWNRQPPSFTEAERAKLPAADRARLALSLARIGAPGAPALLPPELDKPTEDAWLKKAAAAKMPRERVTALYFLNQLKSPKALTALEGLSARDAKTWPRHLHLEGPIATARLNGADMGPGLHTFLEGLRRARKVDPVRAQAARLRLVMAGKEKKLLPPVKATPGSILALMDAWNRAPWEQRKDLALTAFRSLDPNSPAWASLGLDTPSTATLSQACTGILSRLMEGMPTPAPVELLQMGGEPWPCASTSLGMWYGLQGLAKFQAPCPDLQARLQPSPRMGLTDPVLLGSLLPVLRAHLPKEADALRPELLTGSDPVARAAAIDDLTEAPADLDALIERLWKVEEFDGVQELLTSLEKWKMPEDRRKSILVRFLQHPCWTARQDAWTALVKLEPRTPWPSAPPATATDKAIRAEAERLAAQGRPVRLRITFADRRRVTLRLDPANAPMNVANLVLLAKKGYFNGRLVPRVVPDFVVQMGSPCDTMDGGPGYMVRCEDSLAWYGPGSVGMALSEKDTGGSQFFITTNATPRLTGRFTRLGEVEDPDHALPLLDDLELGARIERVEVLP